MEHVELKEFLEIIADIKEVEIQVVFFLETKMSWAHFHFKIY